MKSWYYFLTHNIAYYCRTIHKEFYLLFFFNCSLKGMNCLILANQFLLILLIKSSDKRVSFEILVDITWSHVWDLNLRIITLLYFLLVIWSISYLIFTNMKEWNVFKRCVCVYIYTHRYVLNIILCLTVLIILFSGIILLNTLVFQRLLI